MLWLICFGYAFCILRNYILSRVDYNINKRQIVLFYVACFLRYE